MPISLLYENVHLFHLFNIWGYWRTAHQYAMKCFAVFILFLEHSEKGFMRCKAHIRHIIYSSLSILSHWDFDHWDLKHLCDILSFPVYLFYLTKFLKLKLYSLFYMLASATPLSNSVHPKIINELNILGEKPVLLIYFIHARGTQIVIQPNNNNSKILLW